MSKAPAGIAILFTLVLPGCAMGQGQNWYLRPTPNDSLPMRVVPDTLAGAPHELDPAACHSPLIDPATGVRFILQRSIMTDNGPLGDYSVEPPGSYGVGPKVFIRMDCAIGRPLGSVPR